MNQEMVSVLYYEAFGYIITSYTKFKDSGIPTIMNPVVTVNVDASPIQLGEKILESLEKSKNAATMDKEQTKDFHYWHVSGIKGFGTFSKKFRHVKIFKKEDTYEFIQMDRAKNGGYIISKSADILQLQLNISSKKIGETILHLLSGKVLIQNEGINTFSTVNESAVSYIRPSDDFIDAGDGHTDAYQVYVHDDNDENSIAFLIDNPYREVSEEKIKNKWKQWYGELVEFTYNEVNDSPLEIIIKGKTNTMLISSNLYHDGDVLMEVSTKIDFVNTSTEQQKKIKEEFDKVINSIKIVTK